MKKILFIFVFMLVVPLCVVSEQTTVLAQNNSSRQRPNTASHDILSIDGTDYYIHYVAEGENLTSLARIYGVSVAQILDDNAILFGESVGQPLGLETDEPLEIKAGQVLRVKCTHIPEPDMSRRRYNRTFEEHVVMGGETSYSIAKRYLLPLSVLVEDNPGLDPAVLHSGQILRIRKAEKGESSPEAIMEDMDSITNTLNGLSEDYFYYTVKEDDTIYSLSRLWGVDEGVIDDSNDLTDGLRAGEMLKIPAQGLERFKYRLVEVPLDHYDYSLPQDGGDTLPQDYLYDGTLRIAMLLPLSGGGRANFVEFYQGALLALEDIKSGGHSVDFDLYDTGRSREKAEELVRSGVLDGTHLIVGPVYEDEFGPVADWAQYRGVPLVSPLSELEGVYNGSVYQMPPAKSDRYAKMREIFEGDKNIIVVASETNDSEFERDMLELIGQAPYKRVFFTGRTSSRELESLVAGSRSETVFVITSSTETNVARTLATISSIQNNRRARSMSMPAVHVAGNPSWLRYTSVDRNLFFKLNVTFSTSYHSDRSNSAVNSFDKRYIVAFGTTPSLFSYRGYDAVRIFAEALLGGENSHFPDFNSRLNFIGGPLQTGYRFQPSSRGYMENTDWPLVRYKEDYTITVE